VRHLRRIARTRQVIVGAVVLALAATAIIVTLIAKNLISTERPSPTETTTSQAQATCDGIVVPAGTSLSAGVSDAPAGTTFCLSGSYTLTSPVTPKSGDVFEGPADLTGPVDTGFDVKGASATGVTFDNLVLHDFGLRAIDCWTGTVVRNSELYGNLRNGIGCGLDGTGGVVIENNYIHDNGSDAELGRGGGGMKFAKADGLVVRNNRIERNVGNGLWCDVDCHSFTARANTVWGNSRKGIFFEIGFGPALIEDNVVTFNNCAASIWDASCTSQGSGAPGGGIAINSSVHVTVRNNVLGHNEVAGINVRDDSRPYDAPFDISVTGNTMNGDALLHCGEWGITCSGNI
jgi:hypothetical protein